MIRSAFSRRPGAVLAPWILCSPRAEAHLVSTGLGPIYDGIGHLFLSPEDLLPLVALALLAGLRGARASRHVLWMLPLAWAIGGVAGIMTGGADLWTTIPASALLLSLGGLVAADRPLPDRLVVIAGGLTGVLLGFFDGLAMSAAAIDTALLQVAGIVLTTFVLAALLSALVIGLRDSWARIVVRVAGSWIAATGLLLLGWSLRSQR